MNCGNDKSLNCSFAAAFDTSSNKIFLNDFFFKLKHRKRVRKMCLTNIISLCHILPALWSLSCVYRDVRQVIKSWDVEQIEYWKIIKRCWMARLRFEVLWFFNDFLRFWWRMLDFNFKCINLEFWQKVSTYFWVKLLNLVWNPYQTFYSLICDKIKPLKR